ncbi:MAG: glycosyltransferase family 39 protein, partial [Gammaproteobacteria bacterium]
RPDEPLIAEVAREMLASGDWVVPRLQGTPFLEKPPLHYMAVAVSYRTFGVSPMSARLPVALAALLATLATYLLGARLFDRRTGFWGALLLPTGYMFLRTAAFCVVDGMLALWVVAGFLAASYAFGEDRRPWAIPALYTAAALAFLTKGPVGPALLAPGVVAFALTVSGGSRFFLSRAHLLGLGLFAGLTGSWMLALAGAGGRDFVWEAVIANSVGRFLQVPGLVPRTSSIGEHVFPWYDYLLMLPSRFLPWTPLLLLVVVMGFPRLVGALAANRRVEASQVDRYPWSERFLGVPLLVSFVVLSAASVKRSIYLVPLYPLITLLVARYLRELCRPGRETTRSERFLLGMQAAIATILPLAVAVATWLLAGPYFGWQAPDGTVARAAVLGLMALTSSVFLWRAWLRGQLLRLFRLLWVQTAASVLAFSVLCLPLLEVEYGYDAFFEYASRIEAERGRTPQLYTNNENYRGYAGLHFGVLADFVPPGPDSPAGPTVDVITGPDGLERLQSLPGIHVKTLAVRPTVPGEPERRTLLLVSVSPSLASP